MVFIEGNLFDCAVSPATGGGCPQNARRSENVELRRVGKNLFPLTPVSLAVVGKPCKNFPAFSTSSPRTTGVKLATTDDHRTCGIRPRKRQENQVVGQLIFHRHPNKRARHTSQLTLQCAIWQQRLCNRSNYSWCRNSNHAVLRQRVRGWWSSSGDSIVARWAPLLACASWCHSRSDLLQKLLHLKLLLLGIRGALLSGHVLSCEIFLFLSPLSIGCLDLRGLIPEPCHPGSPRVETRCVPWFLR